MSDIASAKEFQSRVADLKSRFGSSEAVAAHFGVSYQTVNRWMNVKEDSEVAAMPVHNYAMVMGAPSKTVPLETNRSVDELKVMDDIHLIMASGRERHIEALKIAVAALAVFVRLEIRNDKAHEQRRAKSGGK